jgi:hypothetical protein
VRKVEQADKRSKDGRDSKAHVSLKKQKARIERRRAKKDPETPPAYGKYDGYQT